MNRLEAHANAGPTPEEFQGQDDERASYAEARELAHRHEPRDHNYNQDPEKGYAMPRGLTARQKANGARHRRLKRRAAWRKLGDSRKLKERRCHLPLQTPNSIWPSAFPS